MYLFAFYCVFMLGVFVLPTYLLRKRTGINPFRFSKEESAINYVGKTYKFISACAFGLITVYAFFPSAMQYLKPFEFLEADYFSWIGFGLLHLSFIIIFIAQRNMGKQWRIGIDSMNKTTLVTKGLFSLSRNPVFFGVILIFLGLFLIIPNIATAIILVNGYLIIQVQVRLEEEFLSAKLGDEYIQYRKKVKRWLF